MSEQEILEILEKEKEATAKEIAIKLNLSFVAVWRGLKGLFRELEVEKRKLTKEEVKERMKEPYGERGIKFTGRQYIWKIRK